MKFLDRKPRRLDPAEKVVVWTILFLIVSIASYLALEGPR